MKLYVLRTKELSSTCRVSCQNKFVKLVHLFGFIIKKFSTVLTHITALIWNCQFYTVVSVYTTKHSGTHLKLWHVYFYDSICLVALYKTPNSGLGTVLSEAGHFSAFDNSAPSFFNHEWKTEKHHEWANMGKINDLNYGGNCTLRDFQFGT